MMTTATRFFLLAGTMLAFASFAQAGEQRTAGTSEMAALQQSTPLPDRPFEYLPRETITIQAHTGQDYVLDVEMAITPAQQAYGLMNRPRLNNDSGMLFLFAQEDKPSFWMKNTLIPLDMVFIAKDGTINHIHHNAKPLDETNITTDVPALAVLEINGGLSDGLGIAEGDRVLHPAFRNVVAPQ